MEETTSAGNPDTDRAQLDLDRAQEDGRALTKAHEIMRDKKRMQALRHHVKLLHRAVHGKGRKRMRGGGGR